MSDVTEIIDMHAFTQHGVIEQATIDTAVGSDGAAVLNDHPAKMRCQDRDAPVARKSKARFSDDGPRQDCDIIPIKAQRTETVAPMNVRAPIWTPGPITALGPIRNLSPMAAPGPMTQPTPSLALAATRVSGCMAG